MRNETTSGCHALAMKAASTTPKKGGHTRAHELGLWDLPPGEESTSAELTDDVEHKGSSFGTDGREEQREGAANGREGVAGGRGWHGGDRK